MPDWSERWSACGRQASASEIRELLKLLARPGIISFAGGIPEPELFPRDAVSAAYAKVLDDPASAAGALQYSLSEGHPGLRARLVTHLRARGVHCAIENILITSGSQQALDLIARALVEPGDTILTHQPTYLGALQAFGGCRPDYAALARGTSPAAYGASAKFAYVMPDFANPDGQSLSLVEREALLASARAQGFVLVEDAAYVELAYDGPTPPTLLALDAACAGIEAGRVIHCGTFSKTVVPGLRLGWVVAPSPVIAKLVLLKQAADLHSCTLSQTAMAEVLDTLPDGHIERLRTAYRSRRDAMLATLATNAPRNVRWTRPGGGMFVWVELPHGMDAAALLARSVEEIDVAFVPGAAFYPDRSRVDTLRLSFSRTPEPQIIEGIERLCRLIRQQDNHRSAA